jgi:hypothetical protein
MDKITEISELHNYRQLTNQDWSADYDNSLAIIIIQGIVMQHPMKQHPTYLFLIPVFLQ